MSQSIRSFGKLYKNSNWELILSIALCIFQSFLQRPDILNDYHGLRKPNWQSFRMQFLSIMGESIINQFLIIFEKQGKTEKGL